MTARALSSIDPVRLATEQLEPLPRPVAIALTAKCHQRASWRYRAEFGAEVWLPEDAAAAEQEPDHRYAEGDVLPGGLMALRTPGPGVAALLVPAGPRARGAVLLGSRSAATAGSCASSRRSSTRTRRRRGAACGSCWTCRSRSCASTTGRPITDDPKAALREVLEQSD